MRRTSTCRTPERRTSRGQRSVAALAVGAALLLAACGSSDSKTKASAEPSTTTSATTAGVAVVKTADVGDLGKILVDADGKTLYTLTNGTVAVACTGGCLTAWPPLLLPTGTTKATGSSDATQLGTTAQGTGQQVTHQSLPLYRFAADMAAGDANGEGISSFGGTWHVVKISGGTGVGGGGAGTGSTTTTKATSGYGY